MPEILANAPGTNDRYRAGHTGVDNIHCAHRAASVIEHPFLMLVQVLSLHLLIQLADNVVNNTAGVIAMRTDRALRNLVQMVRAEDVELLQTRIEVAVQPGEDGEKRGENAEGAH